MSRCKRLQKELGDDLWVTFFCAPINSWTADLRMAVVLYDTQSKLEKRLESAGFVWNEKDNRWNYSKGSSWAEIHLLKNIIPWHEIADKEKKSEP